MRDLKKIAKKYNQEAIANLSVDGYFPPQIILVGKDEEKAITYDPKDPNSKKEAEEKLRAMALDTEAEGILYITDSKISVTDLEGNDIVKDIDTIVSFIFRRDSSEYKHINYRLKKDGKNYLFFNREWELAEGPTEGDFKNPYE